MYDMETLPFYDEVPAKTAVWLLANKQMLDEGMFQLHQKCTWHFYDNDTESLTSCIFPLNTSSLAWAHNLNISPIENLDFYFGTRTSALLQRTNATLDLMIDKATLGSSVKTLHVTLWCREKVPLHPQI